MDMHVAPVHWSYSSLKNFEGCPQRYYQEKEIRAVHQLPNEHTSYGIALHEAVEDFFKKGTPIPAHFNSVQAVISALLLLPGEKHSELDLSLRKDLTPCKEDDPRVWLKAFADLVVVHHKRALCNDFKTGNWRYADLDQLELYALCIFQHFPAVEEVRGMLLFVKDDRPFSKTYHRNSIDGLWPKWLARLQRILKARELQMWPTKRSGLCKYCPHTRCLEHPSWRSF